MLFPSYGFFCLLTKWRLIWVRAEVVLYEKINDIFLIQYNIFPLSYIFRKTFIFVCFFYVSDFPI